MRSIRDARQAINNMRESRDRREAEIALTHAEEMLAIADRLFSSAVGEESRAARETIADPYGSASEQSEPDGE